MRAKHFQRNEVIFHRDDPAGHVFLIASGTVKVSVPEEGDAMRQLLALLARRIRLSTGHIEDLVFLDLHGRVAKLLLDQNELLGTPNVIALTQEDLASFVGATRVAVNRVLVDLERQGAVKLGRGQVDLVDLVLLKKAIRY